MRLEVAGKLIAQEGVTEPLIGWQRPDVATFGQDHGFVGSDVLDGDDQLLVQFLLSLTCRRIFIDSSTHYILVTASQPPQFL